MSGESPPHPALDVIDRFSQRRLGRVEQLHGRGHPRRFPPQPLGELQHLRDPRFVPPPPRGTGPQSPSQHLGLGHEVGAIRPGLAADLMSVAGDPAADIAALASATDVIQGGRPVKLGGRVLV